MFTQRRLSSQSEPIAMQETLDQKYSYWRSRLMYALIVGYSAFYIVRQNMSIAVPDLLKEFGYTKTQVGWIFTGFSIIYGFSKFISGSICDRSNVRYFMTIGLLGASICNLVMGASSSIVCLGIFYGLNGWFQSMGWPACTRTLTHWYGPKQLATRWGMCNISHQIGSVIILLGTPALILYTGNWRSAFWGPGVLCLLIAAFLFNRLRDTPASLGLPTVEAYENLEGKGGWCEEEPKASYKEIFLKHILPNKPLWTVCIANFFVYVVRMGFFNWAPTFLKEIKGISLMQSGVQTAAFELAGIFGGVLAGWLSDRAFNGYRGRVSFLYMMLLTVAILIFWYVPHVSIVADTLLLFVMGFLIYGPQVLIGVAGAEFGSKQAACAAAGLTGTFGYLGGAASGVGIGYIAENYGWGATLGTFVVAALLGGLCVLTTWNKKPVTAACKVKK